MAGPSGSRAWEVGKSAKKARKDDVDDYFSSLPASPAAHAPSVLRTDLLPDAVASRLGPRQPVAGQLAPGDDIIESPPQRAPNVTEAARAFNQLRVRPAPETNRDASPSISDAPPSPKKRKAAVSLQHTDTLSTQQQSGDDKQQEEETSAAVSGPVGELLQVFGQIQLNQDFYDAIARTESCAGDAPRATRADVDRATFEAAVGAATAVLRTQVKDMAEQGQDASPAFLQAYALNAISMFATQAESYSGETVSASDYLTNGSSINRPSSAAVASQEPSVGNIQQEQDAVDIALSGDFNFTLGDGPAVDGDGQIMVKEQIDSLERSASAMMIRSPESSTGAVPMRGSQITPNTSPMKGTESNTVVEEDPGAINVMEEGAADGAVAAELPPAGGGGNGTPPAVDSLPTSATNPTAIINNNNYPSNVRHLGGRRRERPSSAEGEHPDEGRISGEDRAARRAVGPFGRPMLRTLLERREELPGWRAAAAAGGAGAFPAVAAGTAREADRMPGTGEAAEQDISALGGAPAAPAVVIRDENEFVMFGPIAGPPAVPAGAIAGTAQPQRFTPGLASPVVGVTVGPTAGSFPPAAAIDILHQGVGSGAAAAAGRSHLNPQKPHQRPQAAPGHREKRDPRPSSSGGPSRLSNDPPKRQRKGPGLLVIGSAPTGQGAVPGINSLANQDYEDLEDSVDEREDPIEQDVSSSLRIDDGLPGTNSGQKKDRAGGGRKMTELERNRAKRAVPAVGIGGIVGGSRPGSAAGSRGSVGGGGRKERKKGDVHNYNDEDLFSLDDEANSSGNDDADASVGASAQDVEQEGGEEEQQSDERAEKGQGSDSRAPAAWGSSLVCPDLTLHEVASQYWPSYKAAGAGQSAELSFDEKARLERLTQALESAIIGAVEAGGSGAGDGNRRMTAKVKSLAAASAFDELLREKHQLPRQGLSSGSSGKKM